MHGICVSNDLMLFLPKNTQIKKWAEIRLFNLMAMAVASDIPPTVF